ncbi:MAG: chain-length determining protein, partial [Prevotella sp.]|nr:chain-length determining protein [Prevotella sp.]
MEEKKSQGYGIDYQRVFQEIIKRKRLFVKTLPLAFLLSCIYIFSLPRYYDTDTMLAPETENPMSGGTIGSIASTFGLDLGNMQSSDAITPLLYPNLMEDNG